jgi:Bacterial SH3 domain.
MKQCPVCRTTYTDDSLRYCLADGATLNDGLLTEETVIRNTDRDVVRVPIERDEPKVFSHDRSVTAASAQPSSGKWFKVFLVVAIILVLFAGAAAVAGLILYNNLGRSTANNSVAKSPTPSPSPTVTVSPTPTVDPEKQKLQDELANLQKKIDQQKNANVAVPPPPTPNRGYPTARVNSPGDGFLALRSEPDAEDGDRIAKIPHGATVELNNCERSKVTIGNHTGRWCQITYNGQTGYVFDAFLIY